ncbi:MAG: phosphoribosylformylglycinamidine synthase subunit PurS [Planctomycetota bacterium]
MGLWRIQVFPKAGLGDPAGRQVARLLRDFGIGPIESVRSARLYTIELPGSGPDEATIIARIAKELLTDRVSEGCRIIQPSTPAADPEDVLVVEVHFKPGVLDTVADSTNLALADMGIRATNIRTARRYEVRPRPNEQDARRVLRLVGNDCVENVVVGSLPIQPAPAPPQYEFRLQHVALANLEDAALERLSREGHLFLSLAEMQAIRDHYQAQEREPTDLELETLAQTWSEHCIHKTLKAAIEYRGAPFPVAHASKIATCATTEPESPRPQPACACKPDQAGPVEDDPLVRRYDNLLKETIAQATAELMKQGRGPECLSVFEDNAGIIGFDEVDGIAFKVETHNHPSAIEPYGGAATGIGGVIRDVLGCGLGARPIANTDVFCVGPADWPVDSVPRGVIHPKSILKGIVAGVRDYGNRMGIPTVNGAICFDPRYIGNPLVYCGCVGLIPRDRISKGAQPGDAIVLMGGRTGRDGIHGATFSSAELTDTHEDEFAHAVQIGGPIEEKKVLDVLLQARDYPREGSSDPQPSIVNLHCLYSAVTDCGAGGLSSAVGEMAEETGAEVDLERVPLKYAGLRYDEIWISEAQERMVFAVPPENVDTLLRLAAGEDVEATVIGSFTDTGRLLIRYEGQEVGNLDLAFLHNGVPKTRRVAEWRPEDPPGQQGRRPLPDRADVDARDYPVVLKQRLSNPNTASKHWVIRQYDHEVQGGSVVKPLVGRHDGPSDAAVVRPKLDSNRGIALGCGMAPHLSDVDPYWMAAAAIDEALRNVICVGGDPGKTAILDNFCWPRVDDARHLGALVRACQACHDVALMYGLPFISGKDSLNNEFALSRADAAMLRDIKPANLLLDCSRLVTSRTGPTRPGSEQSSIVNPQLEGRLAIPYTLLISAVSVIEDVSRCITAAPRAPCGEATLFYVGFEWTRWEDADTCLLASLHESVAELIRSGTVLSAHDCSDGGLATAVAEMSIASGLEARQLVSDEGLLSDPFAEPVCGYILEAADGDVLRASIDAPGAVVKTLAVLKSTRREPMFHFCLAKSTSATLATLGEPVASLPLAHAEAAWKSPLDW